MSEISQNPSSSNSKLPTKQLVPKNKSTNKRKSKTTTNNNNSTKPLKVVYISNPMRFQVTAEEFLTLVQGLTGRDAVEWPEYNYSPKTPAAPSAAHFHNVTTDNNNNNNNYEGISDEVQQQELENDDDEQPIASFGSSDLSYDSYYGALDGGDEYGDEQMMIMQDLRALLG